MEISGLFVHEIRSHLIALARLELLCKAGWPFRRDETASTSQISELKIKHSWLVLVFLRQDLKWHRIVLNSMYS